MHHSQTRLSDLRRSIKENSIDIYIITNTDPHLGEYIPDHWRIIAWLTGFTGSSATVVVTEAFAGLWTDSRYYVQAQQQLLGSEFHFMQPVMNDKKDFIDWLSENVRNGSTIGVDGRTVSIGNMRKIGKALVGKDVRYITEADLISEIWIDRPPMPLSVAFDFPVSFCGKERVAKIAEVREKMMQQKTDYHLLTSIDDIMWMLNIRGNDVKYSPLLTSFAIVNARSGTPLYRRNSYTF